MQVSRIKKVKIDGEEISYMRERMGGEEEREREGGRLINEADSPLLTQYLIPIPALAVRSSSW